MKAEDLMVGDWVYITEHPMRKEAKQAKPEHFLRSLVTFEPIPLTPEILEKNGFETKKIMPFKQEFEHRVDVDGRVELDNRSEYIRSNNTWSMYIRGDRGFTLYAELTFVHELQQFLRLCKIDKEITL